MIIDGEKFACEACVRGHRVSNCQHTDRKLQHINKKGRPVTQCQHCRSMRKSRSAHVKCDCGEKTHKCMHLQAPVEGHNESCCCNHGGRCTCAHKKEGSYLDTVIESGSEKETSSTIKAKAPAKSGVRGRRRANTVHTDAGLTFDENGHHKPTYKHAKASQKCEPYQLKRGDSNSSSDLNSKRSLDNLHLAYGSYGSAGLQLQRQVKSEAASPLLVPSSAPQLAAFPAPLDLSAIEYPSYGSGLDFLGGFSDQDAPIFSAGLSATSVDWSHYEGLESGSRLAENFAPSSYSQAQSFTGFEQPPTLTTSNSGDVSEIEDLGPASSLDDFSAVAAFSRTSSSANGFGLSSTIGAASSYNNLEFDTFKAKLVPETTSLADNEATLGAGASTSTAAFAAAEDDGFWLGEYGQGLPGLSEPAEPAVPAFWE